MIFWIENLLFLYNDAKLEKGKGLNLLIFVDLKKEKTDEKKTSKHGIVYYKIMLIPTNKKKINKVIHSNKTLFKHDDATNPQRRERVRW